MSREKMLQAEVALKDEQLADLIKEIERLRRQAEESGKRTQTADAIESQNADLKRTVGKLAPAAKKTAEYAAELNETRRRLAIVEKERSELSKNYSATQGQTAGLKSALTEAQRDARALKGEKKSGRADESRGDSGKDRSAAKIDGDYRRCARLRRDNRRRLCLCQSRARAARRIVRRSVGSVQTTRGGISFDH